MVRVIKIFCAVTNDLYRDRRMLRICQALYDYGLANYNAGNYLIAVKYFNQLIEKFPNIPKYYIARGDAYIEANTYKYAINDYSTALDLNPNFTKIYLNRGYAKYLSGDKIGACADWKTSIKYKDYRANNYLIKYCD